MLMHAHSDLWILNVTFNALDDPSNHATWTQLNLTNSPGPLFLHAAVVDKGSSMYIVASKFQDYMVVSCSHFSSHMISC